MALVANRARPGLKLRLNLPLKFDGRTDFVIHCIYEVRERARLCHENGIPEVGQ